MPIGLAQAQANHPGMTETLLDPNQLSLQNPWPGLRPFTESDREFFFGRERESAELLGLKSETVKTRLHRARALLRESVEKKIGPIVMDAFPFAGHRCDRLTEAVLKRLEYN